MIFVMVGKIPKKLVFTAISAITVIGSFMIINNTQRSLNATDVVTISGNNTTPVPTDAPTSVSGNKISVTGNEGTPLPGTTANISNSIATPAPTSAPQVQGASTVSSDATPLPANCHTVVVCN